MDSSRRLDEHMSAIDKRLLELRTRNEIGRLEAEVTTLEQQLRRSLAAEERSYDEYHSTPLKTVYTPDRKSILKSNKAHTGPPDCSPILPDTPYREHEPDRFVTRRKRVHYRSPSSSRSPSPRSRIC